MLTAKEEVRKMLDGLPDTVSFEDIQYHIYVREKIERGLQDIRDGKTATEAEANARFSQWTNR
jgi:predicted transcriptional regulator